MARLRKIKVVYRKLLREKAWGQCHDDGIEIDPRLKGRKHLEIMLHECSHYLWPTDSEEEIIRKSIILTNTLWHDGYRKIDNDESQPLQDGST
jgi:hypothetical protein